MDAYIVSGVDGFLYFEIFSIFGVHLFKLKSG
jgi:hypothetical protein